MTAIKWGKVSSTIIIVTGVFLLFQAFWPEWYMVQEAFAWTIGKTVGGIALIFWAIISLKLKRQGMTKVKWSKITSTLFLAYGAFLLFETLYTPFGDYILNTLGHFLAKVIGGIALICWGIVFFWVKGQR